MDRALDLMDHPLLYLFALTLGVYAFGNILYFAFVKAGWTGPASFFR